MRCPWQNLLLFSVALFSTQLYATDTDLMQKAIESSAVPMTCGKFLSALSLGDSLSQAQRSKMQEYSDILTVEAGAIAQNQLGEQITQELAEKLHAHANSEFRKVMDEIHSIQDPTARNTQFAKVLTACMGLVEKINSKK